MTSVVIRTLSNASITLTGVELHLSSLHLIVLHSYFDRYKGTIQRQRF